VIGTILSTFLLGVTATQAWSESLVPLATTCQDLASADVPPLCPPLSPLADYFVNFPNDKKVYWWLVVVLCVFDWFHTAISVSVPLPPSFDSCYPLARG